MAQSGFEIQGLKHKKLNIDKNTAVILGAAGLVVILIILIIVLSAPQKNGVITASSVIKKNNDYSFEGLFCETLCDKAVEDGWRYYYVETADSGAVLKNWASPASCVPIELSILVKNLSKEDADFSQRVSCTFVYDNSKEISAMVMQENSGQIAENGENCRSTLIQPVKSEETARIWFVADIPSEYRDSSLPFKAVITIDKSTYTVDLRENMKVFSE